MHIGASMIKQTCFSLCALNVGVIVSRILFQSSSCACSNTLDWTPVDALKGCKKNWHCQKSNETLSYLISFSQLWQQIVLLTFRFLVASWWKIHSQVFEFLSAVFARFHVCLHHLEYHHTVVSEVCKVRPISAYRWNLIFSSPGTWSKGLLHKEFFRQRSWFGKKSVPQTAYLSSEVNKYTAKLSFGLSRNTL